MYCLVVNYLDGRTKNYRTNSHRLFIKWWDSFLSCDNVAGVESV